MICDIIDNIANRKGEIDMPTHIKEIKIESYRGLKGMSISDLGDINILLGNNNCGKTSVLEVLSTLDAPLDFYTWYDNVFYRCLIREPGSFYSRIPQLFCFEEKKQHIRYSALTEKKEEINVSIGLKKSNIFLTAQDVKCIDELAYYQLATHDEDSPDFQIDTEMLQCTISVSGGEREDKVKYDIYPFSRRINRKRKYTSLQIVPTVICRFLENNNINIINKLLEVNRNKTMLIKLLQKFDRRITGISTVDNIIRIESTEYEQTVPLSCYGDGIRQAVNIFCHMIRAEGGLLLIDEFDSAIHVQNMSETIKLIFQACKELNIQLIVTTHNQEAITALLEGAGENLDNMRLIRMRKLSDKIICKTIEGTVALENITELGMEYRI